MEPGLPVSACSQAQSVFLNHGFILIKPSVTPEGPTLGADNRALALGALPEMAFTRPASDTPILTHRFALRAMALSANTGLFLCRDRSGRADRIVRLTFSRDLAPAQLVPKILSQLVERILPVGSRTSPEGPSGPSRDADPASATSPDGQSCVSLVRVGRLWLGLGLAQNRAVFHAIVGFLSVKSAARFAVSCSICHKGFSEDGALWKNLLQRDFARERPGVVKTRRNCRSDYQRGVRERVEKAKAMRRRAEARFASSRSFPAPWPPRLPRPQPSWNHRRVLQVGWVDRVRRWDGLSIDGLLGAGRGPGPALPLPGPFASNLLGDGRYA